MREELVVVEFVGLPGSGKSTLVRMLARELRDAGYSCITNDELRVYSSSIGGQRRLLRFCIRMCLVMHFMLMHPAIVLLSLLCALHMRSGSLAALRRCVSLWKLVRFTLKGIDRVDRPTGTVVLLDQGVLQMTWSIGVTGEFGAETLPPLVKALCPYAPHHVVHVAVLPRIAGDRVQDRGPGSHWYSVDAPVASRIFEDHAKDFDTIIHLAETTCGVRVFCIDGSRTVESNVCTLRRWLLGTSKAAEPQGDVP